MSATARVLAVKTRLYTLIAVTHVASTLIHTEHYKAMLMCTRQGIPEANNRVKKKPRTACAPLQCNADRARYGGQKSHLVLCATSHRAWQLVYRLGELSCKTRPVVAQGSHWSSQIHVCHR